MAQNKINFQDSLQKDYAQYVNLWWETATEFPPLGSPYTRRTQLANEREVEKFIDQFQADLQTFPKSGIPGVFSEEKIHTTFDKLQNSRLESESIIPNPVLAKQFIDPFAKMAGDFITAAYQFDPNLKPADIRQALRNLWTAGSLQILLKQPPHFTPAIFAYSMLYPYTDNYLDDPSIPMSIKSELNQKFQKRLTGEAFTCANSYERALDELVGMIESQFPRPKYPDVYRSLLAIHQAQTISLLFQLQPTSPYERDLLGISFKKGGCSVLADGYLINGDLNEAEAAFCYGYGVFLQLVDDLRDAGTDSQNGQMTIFSQLGTKWPLDRLTNRTIHFSRKILTLLDPFEAQTPNSPNPGPPLLLKELIQNSVTFLILEAISRNQNLYSRDYLNQIKAHTPFRLPYFRKLKSKLTNIENGFSGGTLLRFALISQFKSESPDSML